MSLALHFLCVGDVKLVLASFGGLQFFSPSSFLPAIPAAFISWDPLGGRGIVLFL